MTKGKTSDTEFGAYDPRAPKTAPGGKLYLVIFRADFFEDQAVQRAVLAYGRDAEHAANVAEVSVYAPEGSALAAIELGAEVGLALVQERVPVRFALDFPFNPNKT